MKYGCIGEHLAHSFSKEIHSLLADYEYELCEIPRGELCAFMEKRDFLAINVTIPYKEAVIPHLHYIDPRAEKIGAVNTVVNRDGLLYGYNTDFFGMESLIKYLGLDLEGKKVIILGTGGTSKTASAVASSLGAKTVMRVSRSGRECSMTYEELYEKHSDTDVIINTTPSGMFPNIYDKPVDVSRFSRLSGVVDVVYNPLSTPLVLSARERGIPADGGLFMLVAQAVRASEIFLDKSYPDGVLEQIYATIRSKKENAVLIGMPASGKSTVGKLLAERLGRELIDTDALIVERAGMEIKEIFATRGEAEFRRLESEVIKEVAARSSVIIATGGGAVLFEDNVKALRENGRLFFLDRPPQLLVPTSSRPLSSDRASIEKRYRERYPIYTSIADVRIDASVTADEVAEKIKEFCK